MRSFVCGQDQERAVDEPFLFDVYVGVPLADREPQTVPSHTGG